MLSDPLGEPINQIGFDVLLGVSAWHGEEPVPEALVPSFTRAFPLSLTLPLAVAGRRKLEGSPMRSVARRSEVALEVRRSIECEVDVALSAQVDRTRGVVEPRPTDRRGAASGAARSAVLKDIRVLAREGSWKAAGQQIEDILTDVLQKACDGRFRLH